MSSECVLDGAGDARGERGDDLLHQGGHLALRHRLWLLELKLDCCWLELRELVELELDMALATAVSIWGPRAASTAATSFCCLICSEAAAALAAEAWAATAARR